ncbi:MAG: hypothetical protein DWQ10_08400 [Calditrichaeota bacterium]|nr:MAG: hypothetical protein DWQ10_08400 [Calditrichota bacterium]
MKHISKTKHFPWRFPMIFYSIWLLLGFGLFSIFPESTLAQNLQPPMRHFFVQILLSIYLMGLLAPPVIFYSNLLDMEKRPWLHIAAWHAFGLILFTLIYINVLQFAIEQFFGTPPRRFGGRMRPPWFPGEENFTGRILQPRLFLNALQHIWQAVFFYIIILGVNYSISFYRKFRERELHATQLETQLIHSQLQALKTQLQPHFLFNTLHTLSSLIYEDVPAADKMIRQLSDLLRLTLESTGDQEIPLKRELQHLHLYLEIMQLRFQNRLEVEIKVEDDAKNAFIPTLLLQPLVENSIKHGLEATAGIGNVTIHARRRDNNISLVVQDNGPGFTGEADALLEKGVGLMNTKDRLAKLYGSRHKMDITSEEKKGMRIHIQLPFHTTPWTNKLT